MKRIQEAIKYHTTVPKEESTVLRKGKGMTSFKSLKRHGEYLRGRGPEWFFYRRGQICGEVPEGLDR